MYKLMSRAAAVLGLLPMAQSGRAEVSNLADSKFKDDVTGFIWFDVNQFFGKTYNEVQSMVSTESRFTGFHIATRAELDTLFATNPMGATSSENFYRYVTIMGGAYGSGSPYGRDIISGWYDDGGPHQTYATHEGYAYAFPYSRSSSLTTGWDFQAETVAWADNGAWVVNTTPVPEPVNAALVVGVVAAAAAFRRRRVRPWRPAFLQSRETR